MFMGDLNWWIVRKGRREHYYMGTKKRDRSMIIMGNRRRDYIGNGKIHGTTTLHGGSSDVKDVC